jgi:hypothetical protein
MSWPEIYYKSEEQKCWISSPATSSILEAKIEQKRLSNTYRDSRVTVERMVNKQHWFNDYYFVRIRFSEEDESFFIMQETNV